MTAKLKGPPKPWTSGFCAPSNPPDSHRRCREASEHGNPCVCPCHVVARIKDGIIDGEPILQIPVPKPGEVDIPTVPGGPAMLPGSNRQSGKTHLAKFAQAIADRKAELPKPFMRTKKQDGKAAAYDEVLHWLMYGQWPT